MDKTFYSDYYDDSLIWVELPYDTEYRVHDGIMYIRGTDSLTDMLLNVWLHGGNSLNVHQGFWEQAQVIMTSPGIEHVIKNVHTVTGHSAGAAIAIICGYIWDKPSIGYNCPKFVKRADFLYSKPLYAKKCRIINQFFDIVGHIPLGFHHPVKVEYDYYRHLNPFNVHSRVPVV